MNDIVKIAGYRKQRGENTGLNSIISKPVRKASERKEVNEPRGGEASSP
ncbi:hypothetical protein ACMS09_002495 [Cronobacter malonaticus]